MNPINILAAIKCWMWMKYKKYKYPRKEDDIPLNKRRKRDWNSSHIANINVYINTNFCIEIFAVTSKTMTSLCFDLLFSFNNNTNRISFLSFSFFQYFSWKHTLSNWKVELIPFHLIKFPIQTVTCHWTSKSNSQKCFYQGQ